MANAINPSKHREGTCSSPDNDPAQIFRERSPGRPSITCSMSGVRRRNGVMKPPAASRVERTCLETVFRQAAVWRKVCRSVVVVRPAGRNADSVRFARNLRRRRCDTTLSSSGSEEGRGLETGGSAMDRSCFARGDRGGRVSSPVGTPPPASDKGRLQSRTSRQKRSKTMLLFHSNVIKRDEKVNRRSPRTRRNE